jgi:voltage-gated potassium channel Kch
MVLGVGGFVQQSDDLDLPTTPLDNVYFTLQLAALEFRGASSSINWRLQVARFVAPVIAASTLIQSASVVFREQFDRFRARRARRHTIVCGAGVIGSRLTAALVADGREVVVVTDDAAGAGAAAARAAAVPVVVGDASDASVLSAARADRASRVVAVTGDDATNVAVAAAIAGIDRLRNLPPVRLAVHLDDADLAFVLRPTELAANDGPRVEFFNVLDRGAVALLAEHPLATDGSAHLVVIGVGRFGASVVVHAAQRHRADDLDAAPLAITLVDRQAERRYHAVRMQHPALGHAVAADFVELDFGAPTASAVDAFERMLAEHPPTLVVVAFEDESLCWSSGLFVQQRLPPGGADVVVRTVSDGGFGSLLPGRRVTGAQADGVVGSRLLPFPALARACTVDLIEGGVREQLARAIHEDHVARAGSGAGLHRAWTLLSDDERESSRAAADGIVGRLASIGVSLVPLRSWQLDDSVFTPDELERLASDEHARWKAEREGDGWTWGATRDDVQRTNPLLVDWEALSDDARAANVTAAAELPAMLARAGFGIDRRR